MCLDICGWYYRNTQYKFLICAIQSLFKSSESCFCMLGIMKPFKVGIGLCQRCLVSTPVSGFHGQE